MIGILRDAYDTGLYAAASKLTQATSFAFMAVTIVFAPRYAALHAKNDESAKQKLFDKTRLFMISTTTAAAFGLYLIHKPVFEIFGPTYIEAAPALLVLLIGYTFNTIWGPVAHAMLMIDKEHLTMWITLTAVLLNIVLNAIFIHLYGYLGAAIATAISVNARNAALYIFMKCLKTP